MARIIVGVTGGIAAYKVPGVVRGLQRAGHDVLVIPTPSALAMVGAPTWEALAGHRVATGVFDHPEAVAHVTQARGVDLIVVAPATANTLAKLAGGLADNLLTSTILAATAPVVVFPAMHTAMWTNPATQANVATLRSRGIHVVTPECGDLSSGDTGLGRLPETSAILRSIAARLEGHDTSLRGRRVVVSAGGTREPIDPVRFLGNRSSGRFGCELAGAAAARGADVTLVAAHVDPGLIPAGVSVVEAPTAQDMDDAMTAQAQQADLVIMAAAVADYRPERMETTKRKKEGEEAEALSLNLVATTDVLRHLVDIRKPAQVIVGFAAETGDHRSVWELGRAKARRKGADLLAINEVGVDRGFGDVATRVLLVDAHGEPVAELEGTKAEVAGALIAEAASRLPRQ